MKKIGIVTFHRATNYGAVLQSYSLITYLKSHISDASFEIVDYSTRSAAISHLKSILSYIKDFNFKSAIGEYRKNKMFKRFSDSLPISSNHIVSDNIEEFNHIVNSTYDIVITGSDAIFSWDGKKFPTAYFLHDIHCPTLSYAASAHRLMYKSEAEERMIYAKEAFESLCYLGVRDKETESFVSYSGAKVQIHHNCDPTFLLDINDIHHKANLDEIKKKCHIIDQRPIIVLMTPDNGIAKIIKREYAQNYNIVSVFVDNKAISPTIYDLTPFEWATLFSMADLTVTEYFHATILSLLNSTPTLAIDKLNSKTGYEGKIKDLLFTRLNLPELYVNVSDIDNGASSVIIQRANDLLNGFDREKLRVSIELERNNVDSFVKRLKALL